jgi:hypothetical protein
MLAKEDYRPRWVPERIIVKGKGMERERERSHVWQQEIKVTLPEIAEVSISADFALVCNRFRSILPLHDVDFSI